MQDECIICKAPLVYSDTDQEMECVICHVKEQSKTMCVNGHYICDKCHMQGLDAVFAVCLDSNSSNPYRILRQLTDLPFCHTHGPEHHILVGVSLLTAYRNAGGELDLPKALLEMQTRGGKVPGGACGYWGACGAGISAGMFISIVTKANPLANEAWGQANTMTSKALASIGKIGGPRCCKRNSYLAISEAVVFAKEELGVEMEMETISCHTYNKNNQCIGRRCPFYNK